MLAADRILKKLGEELADDHLKTSEVCSNNDTLVASQPLLIRPQPTLPSSHNIIQHLQLYDSGFDTEKASVEGIQRVLASCDQCRLGRAVIPNCMLVCCCLTPAQELTKEIAGSPDDGSLHFRLARVRLYCIRNH